HSQPHEVDLPKARRLLARRGAPPCARARSGLALVPGGPCWDSSSYSCHSRRSRPRSRELREPARPQLRRSSSTTRSASTRPILIAPTTPPPSSSTAPSTTTLFTYKGSDVTQPVPLLVESWTSAGSRSFTFRLKRTVDFADGTPLTSADVVFSLRRLIN